MPPTIDTLDKLAGASDRYLLVAAVLFIVWFLFYQIKEQRKAEAIRDASDIVRAKAHNEFMTTLFVEQVKLQAQTLVTLQDCNLALKENKQSNDRLVDRLDRDAVRG